MDLKVTDWDKEEYGLNAILLNEVFELVTCQIEPIYGHKGRQHTETSSHIWKRFEMI